MPSPLSAEVLAKARPESVRELLGRSSQTALLAEGPGWALIPEKAAREALAELGRSPELAPAPAPKTAKPPLPQPGDPPDLVAAVGLAIRGRPVLEKLRPDEAATLERWRGRGADLFRKVLRPNESPSPAPREADERAAVKAARIGHLLDKEDAARGRRIDLPRFMEHMRPELERIDRRCEAMGIKSPLTPDALRSASPNGVGRMLQKHKEAPLLGEGPAWTLAGKDSKNVVADLGRDLDRCRKVEDYLMAGLMRGRFSRDEPGR